MLLHETVKLLRNSFADALRSAPALLSLSTTQSSAAVSESFRHAGSLLAELRKSCERVANQLGCEALNNIYPQNK